MQGARYWTTLDDIVIFNRYFDEHLNDLEAVFKMLCQAGVSLRFSKSVFAASQVEYLGFVLSAQGIRPQRKLTEAIKTFATPKTRKEVKRFLGMAGFYREFINNFAHMAVPLNNLTKDIVMFQCELAFTNLKEALSSAPVVAFPQTNQEFIVQVDASKYAVGGILLQKQIDDSIHPIAYFSTSLSQCPTELVTV